MRVEVKRINENYGLEALNETGNSIIIDSNKTSGGDDLGFRPMQMLLAAFGGCSSIDVIRDMGKDANLWKTVHAHFIITGNVSQEKAERAVQLSIEKFCSVALTLQAAGAVVTSSVEVQ